MKTITLKADDNFINILNEMVEAFNSNKSEIIRKSVLYYRDILEKEKLKREMKLASQKVKNHSLKIAQSYDSTLQDGIVNDI